MLMLAFVFQSLAMRRPDLDAGVYAYAKAGFGEYLGFFSAFGYWASACVGNVTYWILIMSTIGALAPALGDGDTALAFILSSVGVWLFYLLIRRGVKEAAVINRIVTVAKLVPILFFIVLALFYLKPHVFADNWNGGSYGSLFDQVKGTMLATVFVFLGVEGASVYSRHARRREDVGRATIVGFLSVLSIFASVTIVSYGLMPLDQIAELRQPSMAGVLRSAVGEWGTVFISVGLIVSVLGAYLAWTLMSAEVLFVAAKDDDMPRFLKKSNAEDVPGPALLMTTILVQVMLLITVLSEDAFNFALDLTSALSLIPFILAAGYALKLGATGETYGAGDRHRTRELVIGALATVYTDLPAVRRRPEVHPRLDDRLRAGVDPVRHGPARAGQAPLLAARAGHAGRLDRRGGRRDRRARHRCDLGLGVGDVSEPARPTGWDAPGRRIALVVVAGIVVALVAGSLGALIAHASDSSSGSASSSPARAATVSSCPGITVADAVLPSVVTLFVRNGSTGAGGSGSGETIRADGYILTNDHVIASAANGGAVQVLFSDGHQLPATIVGQSELLDLAVVKVKPDGSLPTIAIGDSERLRVGQAVVALGAPLGLDGTVTAGIVSALGRDVPVPNSSGGTAILPGAVQTDAAINPGNSGGALVDCNGRLVGINTSIATVPNAEGQASGGSSGIGFAIPVDLATQVADQLIAKGHFTVPYFGVSTAPAVGQQPGGSSAACSSRP